MSNRQARRKRKAKWRKAAMLAAIANASTPSMKFVAMEFDCGYSLGISLELVTHPSRLRNAVRIRGFDRLWRTRYMVPLIEAAGMKLLEWERKVTCATRPS